MSKDDANKQAFNEVLKLKDKELAAFRIPAKHTEPEIEQKPLTVRERIDAGEFDNRRGTYPMNRDKYRARQAEAIKNFRNALEAEHGFVNHPKADDIWNMAWEQGHSSGLSDVAAWYEDLARLLVIEPANIHSVVTDLRKIFDDAERISKSELPMPVFSTWARDIAQLIKNRAESMLHGLGMVNE